MTKWDNFTQLNKPRALRGRCLSPISRNHLQHGHGFRGVDFGMFNEAQVPFWNLCPFWWSPQRNQTIRLHQEINDVHG